MPPFKIYTQDIAEQLVKDIGTVEITTADENGTFEVIASTEYTDRHGEIVKQNGWKLDNYLKNPVILTNHRYAVENICGKATDIRFENSKMIISGVFAPNELGQEVRKLYDAGFLKAVSVGFIPLSWDETNRDIITSAELIELSFVPIPANPEALALAKSLGLKGEMIEKSSELIAIEGLVKSFETLSEKVSAIEKILVNGKTISDAEKEQKENLQIAARAINEALRDFKAKRA